MSVSVMSAVQLLHTQCDNLCAALQRQQEWNCHVCVALDSSSSRASHIGVCCAVGTARGQCPLAVVSVSVAYSLHHHHHHHHHHLQSQWVKCGCAAPEHWHTPCTCCVRVHVSGVTMAQCQLLHSVPSPHCHCM